MLDFRLDEEQEMLVDAIGRFSAEKVRKTFREAEESGESNPPRVIEAVRNWGVDG